MGKLLDSSDENDKDSVKRVNDILIFLLLLGSRERHNSLLFSMVFSEVKG